MIVNGEPYSENVVVARLMERGRWNEVRMKGRPSLADFGERAKGVYVIHVMGDGVGYPLREGQLVDVTDRLLVDCTDD